MAWRSLCPEIRLQESKTFPTMCPQSDQHFQMLELQAWRTQDISPIMYIRKDHFLIQAAPNSRATATFWITRIYCQDTRPQIREVLLLNIRGYLLMQTLAKQSILQSIVTREMTSSQVVLTANSIITVQTIN